MGVFETAEEEILWKMNGNQIAAGNKEAFQSNANCPLADSIAYILSKFEQFLGSGWTVRSKLNKFEHVKGMPLYWEPPPHVDRQTDTTENITFTTPLADGNKYR